MLHFDVCFARNLLGLLVAKSYAMQQIYHTLRGVGYAKTGLYPRDYLLAVGIKILLEFPAEFRKLNRRQTTPIALVIGVQIGVYTIFLIG